MNTARIGTSSDWKAAPIHTNTNTAVNPHTPAQFLPQALQPLRTPKPGGDKVGRLHGGDPPLPQVHPPRTLFFPKQRPSEQAYSSRINLLRLPQSYPSSHGSFLRTGMLWVLSGIGRRCCLSTDTPRRRSTVAFPTSTRLPRTNSSCRVAALQQQRVLVLVRVRVLVLVYSRTV